MDKWKNAATLIIAARQIVKESSGDLRKTCENFKLLTLRRHGKSSFMPTKIVFPGGALSEADHSHDWKTVFKKISNTQLKDIALEQNGPVTKFPMIQENNRWQIASDIALRICAIRETFEESGLLIALTKSQYDVYQQSGSMDFIDCSLLLKDSIEMWRNKILKNPFEFIRLCECYNIVPNIWALMEWSNWLTPTFPNEDGKKGKRYDTMFYISCFDVETLPSVSPAPDEMTEANWISPRDLLDKNREDAAVESSLAPPQLYEILEFSKLTIDKLRREACNRNHSERERTRFLPVFIPCRDGYVLVLPGDYLYPDDPEGLNDVRPKAIDLTLNEIMKDENGPRNRFFYRGSKFQPCLARDI